MERNESEHWVVLHELCTMTLVSSYYSPYLFQIPYRESDHGTVTAISVTIEGERGKEMTTSTKCQCDEPEKQDSIYRSMFS